MGAESDTSEAKGRMPTSPGLRIGRILGIPIYVHASWLIIFVLITSTLAMQFGQTHPSWTEVQQWSIGLTTSVLFFASVVFHELSHSMVARLYKIRVISITLFVFGGVARLGREPSKPSQEFKIAIAGPLASLLLAGVWLGSASSARRNGRCCSHVSCRNEFDVGGVQFASGFPIGWGASVSRDRLGNHKGFYAGHKNGRGQRTVGGLRDYGGGGVVCFP